MEKTAMKELAKHFIDAWSSPGDLWNPKKVIDKIESMIPKERQQIEDAYDEGVKSQHGIQTADLKFGAKFYTTKYGG